MLPPTAGSVTSVKLPPFMFGEDTSSTSPSQNTPPLISVLKLLRKLNVAAADVTLMLREIRYLSLIPFWSGMKASLGGVSAVSVVVTHRVGSGIPIVSFIATHPAGRAGAVTPSKFSMHAGCGVGLGLGDATGVGEGDGEPPGVGDGDGVPPGVGDGGGVPPGVGDGDGGGGPLP